MEPIIKTEKLTHVYSAATPFERVAITEVDFEAYRGEYIGIIGHTGSGKSTFIQHLNGLLKPTSGRVFFDGRDIHETKERARETRFKIGLVFQYPEYQLFEETVFRDIAFGPRNMNLTDAEVEERVREAADFVGLRAEELEKSPFELSGGQKRRAAIAGVIAMRPEALVLDEPTAGLDPRGRDEILENVRAYQSRLNTTVIVVTHSMEEIAKSASRVAVFDTGKIVMDGKPETVFSKGAELEAMGLGVPKAARIAARLRELGLYLSGDIYTVGQLKNALGALKGGGGHA
ncbi:MAG: energy-coupling factor transporter ATPase [Oscillospiraceae bacterium]|nr:energy-coupling factor transporter ATPase [Oscillospiraceae bacterium]